jgi:nucleoside-diphosphate-sugar epimerase
MNILVIGANGLLATNTILLLLEKGFNVKALLRNKNKFIPFKHKNLVFIEGDITNVSSIENAFVGCDYVLHAAANTSQSLLSLSDYYPVNIQGTKNIIECCKKHKIKKLIYIGTANSFGYGSIENLGNETIQQKKPFTNSIYAISKYESQQLINNTKELNIVSICPTFMIGAYDAKPSSGKIILLANKKIIFYPPGGKNFIHVKDVSNAIVNALEYGKNGENYILANENMSYKAFFKLVNEINSKHPVLIKLPKVLLLTLGYIGDFIRWFRRPINLSSVNTKLIIINSFYSNEKAKKDLKINFTSTEVAIKDALEWFKKEGVLNN